MKKKAELKAQLKSDEKITCNDICFLRKKHKGDSYSEELEDKSHDSGCNC